MASLAVNVVVPNGTRLEVGRVTQDTDSETMYVNLELRGPTNHAINPDAVIARKVIQVRNGACDLIRVRQLAQWSPGMMADELLEVVPRGITVATGYDDAAAVYNTGAKPGRRNALVAEGRAKGWIHVSLG